MSYPIITIPSLVRERPPLFQQLNLDGYCSYWHYMPLAARVCAHVKPTSILEMGFFLGSSAYCWLSNSNANVISCDPIIDCAHDAGRVWGNIANLKGHFGVNRFQFLHMSSADIYETIKGIPFDFAFVDGAHDTPSVIRDLDLCYRLRIPHILLDDYANTVAAAHSQRLDKWTGVEGYSLENGDRTNPIDCLLCKRNDEPVAVVEKGVQS